MAFGKGDADALYKDAIRPVLKAAGVAPVRVDQKEHNRNVNDVIMSELDRADLVVADLTYSRPSVYFEAGYGERGVPVIYTVRRDHLAADTSSGNQNHRVHFDVSMRNIIAWSNADHARFRKRLAKRLTHVLAPIKARRNADERARQLASAYSGLSIQDQVVRLHTALEESLAAAGFRTLQLDHSRAVPFPLSLFGRIRGRQLRLIVALTVPHTTPKKIAHILNFWDSMVFMDRQPQISKLLSKITEVEESIIIASPERLDFNGVRRLSRSASADSSSRCLKLGDVSGPYYYCGRDLLRTVYFFDSIEFPSVVLDLLKSRLSLEARPKKQLSARLDRLLTNDLAD